MTGYLISHDSIRLNDISIEDCCSGSLDRHLERAGRSMSFAFSGPSLKRYPRAHQADSQEAPRRTASLRPSSMRKITGGASAINPHHAGARGAVVNKA